MAFLFNKFQVAIKSLAKSPTFAKDPRSLQFEAEINRLFLSTRWSALNGAARPAFLICTRGYKLIPRDPHGEYQNPWHNPGKGNFVTHIDATPDSYSKKGGATAFVTRDFTGRVLDRGTKWMPGIVDSLRLEFHALINYTSQNRLTQLQHHSEGDPNIIICTDSMEVLNHVNACRKIFSQPKDLKLLAETVVKNLNSNFPPKTVLMWIPRDNNGLADILSRYRAMMEARYRVRAEAESAAVIVLKKISK